MSFRSSSSFFAIAVALAAAPALAQQAPAPTSEPLQEIVVTGTSIRGVASAGSPTVGIDIEELRQSGASTASEAARLLPQVLNLGADESRSSFNGGAQDGAANSTAVNGVNLRGLGPESTLLLVNGRRIAASGVIKSLYDINVVPSNAIARMEVVTDGASAIYGADAVAGVVNIITRKRNQETESLAKYAFGDSINQKVFGQTLTGGWQGGGFFAAFEANVRSNLAGRDRSWASQDRRARGGSDARSTLASPGNIIVGTTRYALPAGNGIGVNPASLTAGTVNYFDEGFDADLLPSQNRKSGMLSVWHELTPKLEWWFDGFLTDRNFSLDAPASSGTLTVPIANPFFIRPVGVTATTTRVEYRLLKENGSPESKGDERNFQVASGFDYDLGSDFKLSVYGDFARNRGYQARQNVINNPALTAALNSAIASTAFNPFGDGSFNLTNIPGLVDIISAERFTTARSTQKDTAAKIDGPLLAIPGGDVRFAAGVEYHEQRFEQRLDATNTIASGATATKLVDNKRDYYSVFGELFVPLVGSSNAMAAVQRLELSLAARYDEYSDFGSTTNPKVGVIYEPVKGVALRGTYGTSFRAPSLVDTSGQILNIFIQNLTDPASATGTTRGFFYNGGNPDLTPEEATTWSFGVDVRPNFLPDLKASVNYYLIDYKNRIDVVPNTALATPVYAQFATRRPTDATALAAFNARLTALMASPDLQNPVEPITNINAIVDGRRQNLGSLKQEGLDINVTYSVDTDSAGRFTAALDVADILKLTRRTAPGSPDVDVLDTFNNPVDLRMRGALLWNYGGVSAAAFVNYVDGYRNTAITPNVDVDSYTTLDLSLTYDFKKSGLGTGLLEGMSVTLSAQNVTDEDPPVVLNGTLSYDTQNINPIGRFIGLQVTKRW